jgi:hypothetical protein
LFERHEFFSSTLFSLLIARGFAALTCDWCLVFDVGFFFVVRVEMVKFDDGTDWKIFKNKI